MTATSPTEGNEAHRADSAHGEGPDLQLMMFMAGDPRFLSDWEALVVSGGRYLDFQQVEIPSYEQACCEGEEDCWNAGLRRRVTDPDVGCYCPSDHSTEDEAACPPELRSPYQSDEQADSTADFEEPRDYPEPLWIPVPSELFYLIGLVGDLRTTYPQADESEEDLEAEDYDVRRRRQ